MLSKRVRTGEFSFSPLKFHAIPKRNGKYRILCIPTVQDRLVQRVILRYLIAGDKLNTINDVSFGFISDEEKSLNSALKRACYLRGIYNFCIKTDIISFFDNIERSILLDKFPYSVRRSGLYPVIENAIGSELARPKSKEDRKILAESGIRKGIGLRQGMPLSPVLSNLFLRKFDERVIARSIPMIRYADDLILFFKTQQEAEKSFIFVQDELAKIRLEVPLTAEENTKTELIGPDEKLEVLGIDLRFVDGRVRKFVPTTSFERVSERILNCEDWKAQDYEGKDFGAVLGRMHSMKRSYLSTYSGTENFGDLRAYLDQRVKRASLNIWEDILGADAVRGLNQQQRRFLGIESRNRRKRRHRKVKTKNRG